MHSRYSLWIVIVAVIGGLDYAWAHLLGIRIRLNYEAVLLILALVAIYVIVAKIRRLPRIAAFVLALAQFISMICVLVILSYLTTSLDFPLIDRQLASIDQLLGLNWLATFNWVKAHPVINNLCNMAYLCHGMQIYIILAVLSVTERFERIREFLFLFSTTLLITIVISAFLPAAGAWVFYSAPGQLDYVADFNALRSGTMSEIDMNKATGLIQFPSFHAALGLIYIIAVRGIYVLFPLLICLNTLMIASAVIVGGHHFSDIFAGLALVPLVWLTLRRAQITELPEQLSFARS
jgi:membrane-associated phospholipid phosphatase